MINERFVTYFRETFFQEKPEELEEFLRTIEQSIPRTIRIKPDKVDEVKERLNDDGWILNPTNIFNVFSIDRREDIAPFERRLGFSLDHLIGNFYIQELAAAHPVDILANRTIVSDNFLILDLAASPWGKTTQLTEYFPNSFIIANEPTRERIPQLLHNLERIGAPNVGITLYPGQYWKKFPETFDRILLDAPCSGEWTLYKGTDAVKHWHIKNIKQISRLQERLLDASLHALKIWGEMIYSTCSLNLLENEWVIEAMKEKYPWTFEITFQKKFWPHIDKTGWFFVTKIKKTDSLKEEDSENKRWWNNKTFVERSNTSLRIFRWRLWDWKAQEGITLLEHEGKILAVSNVKVGESIRESIFPMRWGEYIGNIQNGRFVPNALSGRFLDTSNIIRHTIHDEQGLDLYLRGNTIESHWEDEYVLIEFNGVPISLEQRKNGIISNIFPKDWQRK